MWVVRRCIFGWPMWRGAIVAPRRAYIHCSGERSRWRGGTSGAVAEVRVVVRRFRRPREARVPRGKGRGKAYRGRSRGRRGGSGADSDSGPRGEAVGAAEAATAMRWLTAHIAATWLRAWLWLGVRRLTAHLAATWRGAWLWLWAAAAVSLAALAWQRHGFGGQVAATTGIGHSTSQGGATGRPTTGRTIRRALDYEPASVVIGRRFGLSSDYSVSPGDRPWHGVAGTEGEMSRTVTRKGTVGGTGSLASPSDTSDGQSSHWTAVTGAVVEGGGGMFNMTLKTMKLHTRSLSHM